MSAAAIIPAAIMGVGAIQQGQAGYEAGQYNAGMDRQMAQIARQNGIDQARQVARANYLRLGTMQADAGATGASKSPGFLDVLADSASQMKLQEQNTLYEGELNTARYRNSANVEGAAGSAARTGGYLRAAGDLAGGSYGMNLFRSGSTSAPNTYPG